MRLLSPTTILLATTLPLIASGQGYRLNKKEHEPLVKRRKKQVFSHADACVAELGTSLGVSFLDCILNKLKAAERNYKKSSSASLEGDDYYYDDDDPFPVPYYTRHPLTIHEDNLDKANHGTMLMDFIRNYTCARDIDGGSPVKEETEWIYDEEKVRLQLMEQSCSADDAEVNDAPSYITAKGYLPAGDDVGNPAEMDVEAAKKYCDDLPLCKGFTFQTTAANKVPTIFFKAKASLGNVGRGEGWESYIQKKESTYCTANAAQKQQQQASTTNKYEPPRTYKVEILRHEPLVAIIPNFASEEDCNMLIKAGGSYEDMGRAHETNGPTSYRRSYSSDINVNYDNHMDPITRFAERMFAFVRDITGYDVRGPGQEPINAVLYKDVGDEYRPHCDGPCQGQRNQYGKRVATSILYCRTSDGGGQTSFTRSGMMVSPRPRDLLLFAYKYENGTMDNGFTEHSGCPITAGRKWIATQWYREGVDYEHPWNIMEEWGR